MVNISGSLLGDDGNTYNIDITRAAAPATVTSLALAATPATPQPLGTVVTATATVTPANAVGSVVFSGTGNASPVPVVGGVASQSFSPTTSGTISIGASFTPADPTSFVASSATTVSYVIASGETVLTKSSWTPTLTWDWAADSLLGTTSSSDQYAQATVSGLSDADHNAGFEFRASSAYGSGITVAMSGTQWKIEGPNVGLSGSHSGSSGTLRAELQGSTVRIYWNGTLVTTQTISPSPAPTAKGVRAVAWQSTTGVTLSSISASSLGAVAPQQAPGAPVLTGTTGGSGQAALSWVNTGNDASSFGIYQGGALIASTPNTTYIVSGLTNGTAYTFVVVASNSAGSSPSSNTASVTPAAGSTSSSVLLGVSGTGAGNRAVDRWMTHGPGVVKATATWIDVQNGDASNLTGEFGTWGVNPGEIIDVAVGAHWSTWSAAATGSWDAAWRSRLQGIATAWGTRPKSNLRLRFAHEFDGNWMPWSVVAGDASNFVTAFRRWAAIARQEVPGALLVFSPTSSGLQRGYDMTTFWPGSAYADRCGVDTYNEWPHKTTAADVQSQWINGSLGVETWRAWCSARGTTMCLPEWGNAGAVRADASGGGGDAPEYVNAIFAWAKANGGVGAGKVEYIVYFNISSGYPAHFQLFDGVGADAVQPLTAAAFRAF